MYMHVFMIFVCLAMLHFTISIFCFFMIKSISFKFLLKQLYLPLVITKYEQYFTNPIHIKMVEGKNY